MAKTKTKEEEDKEREIELLEKAVARAEARGQKDTSYHVLLARLKNPPKETKEKELTNG